jgi:hypothetical protein
VVILTLLPWGVLGLAYRIPIVLTDLAHCLLRDPPPAQPDTRTGPPCGALYLSGSLGLLAFLIGSLVAA